MQTRDRKRAGRRSVVLLAGRDFNGNGGDLEVVLKRGSFVRGVEAAVFTMSVEALEVLGLKIWGIENIVDQAVNFTLRLGTAAGIHPTHQPPN